MGINYKKKKMKLEVEADRAQIVLNYLGKIYMYLNKKNIRLQILCQRLQNFNINIEEFLNKIR